MEPGALTKRLKGMRGGDALLTVLLVFGTGGCGLLFDDSASATWVLAPKQDMSSATSQFHVMVTRTGCNSGVTGDVQPPEVERDGGQVVLTFNVKPGEPSSATCEGNKPVRYQVQLDEPLGQARLVDGYCLDEHTADDISCLPSSVRYSP